MSLLQTIKGIFTGKGDKAFNGSSFDAANYSSRRSRTPGAAPTDFKHEFHGGARMEILKKSRYICRNNGLPREIRDLNVLYGVGGKGLWPYPDVADPQWANDASEYFRKWAQKCDVTRRFSFVDIQRFASMGVDVDGEIFPTKVRDRITGMPLIQMIETHRVGNFMDGDEDKWIDGIKVNAQGRPLMMKVLLDDGKTRNIPWSAVMHIFNAESPSAYRHAPLLTHSVNHILDQVELLALEKHAAKQNSDMVHVLKTDAGSMESSGDFSATGGRDAVEEGTDPKALQRITGGKTAAIFTHEELESFESKRPTSTFMGFLEHLSRDSTLGAMPYEFSVDPAGTGGPGVRMIVAKAQRRFRARTELIASRLVKPTWTWVIGDAIDRGILSPITGWNDVTVTPPKDITIDSGRDSEANRRDVSSGLKLPTTSYEEQGGNFLKAMEKRGDLINAVHEIAKQKGVDPELLYDWTVASGAKVANSGSGSAPSGGDTKTRK